MRAGRRDLRWRTVSPTEFATHTRALTNPASDRGCAPLPPGGGSDVRHAAAGQPPAGGGAQVRPPPARRAAVLHPGARTPHPPPLSPALRGSTRLHVSPRSAEWVRARAGMTFMPGRLLHDYMPPCPVATDCTGAAGGSPPVLPAPPHLRFVAECIPQCAVPGCPVPALQIYCFQISNRFWDDFPLPSLYENETVLRPQVS